MNWEEESLISMFWNRQKWRLSTKSQWCTVIKGGGSISGQVRLQYWRSALQLEATPFLSTVVPFARWNSQGRCSHCPQRRHSPSSTEICASPRKEQRLLGVSTHRAACNWHTTCLYLFVLSGINYVLQTAMESFVTWLHGDRISATAKGTQYCPGSAEALVLTVLGQLRKLNSL